MTTNRAPIAGEGPAPTPRRGLGVLLAGLPAVAAAAAFAGTHRAGAWRPLAESYGEEAVRRAKARDLPGALVCYKRLLTLEPDRADVRYAMVIALDQLGRGEQAEALARSIAPADRAGYPPAHFWIARRILADRPRLSSRAAAAEGHLLRFLQAFPKSPEAKSMLGTLYSAIGRFGEARPLLEASAGKEPDRLLELARVRRALGDREGGRGNARTAMAEARRRAEARPDDKFSTFLWAKACADLEDYAGALKVLEKGKAMTRDPAFDPSMAAVCSSWADSLGRSGASPGERLAVLQRGLKYDGGNTDLLDQVGSFLSGGGQPAEEARAAVRAALASGRSPALAHFLLGNDAWARGEVGEARNHWEQANRLDPGITLVANNLAWLLAHREPIDLTRAGDLIDQALARSPGDPRLHGTRGEVLIKMGRWKDAVSEIEAALAGGANTPALHAALATAYDRLGMPEMAAEHRKP